MSDIVDGSHIPTSNYLEPYDLLDTGSLEHACEMLCEDLERGYFIQWEAVERQEQGLPLTKIHEESLSGLFTFNEEEYSDESGDDEGEYEKILYIDGLPRPSEPWHAILKKIAGHLPLAPIKTFDAHYAITTEGWPCLVKALQEHGEGLSLPPGAATPVDVVPAETRHRLWVQSCFEALLGIGQREYLTLRNSDQLYRLDDFIDALRDCSDSVEYLGLTLEKILSILILPAADEKILVDAMMKKLKLTSQEDLLSEYL